MSKTLSNQAHVTDTSLAFAAKNASAISMYTEESVAEISVGWGRKIGSLSGIFGFVKILKAIEYIPKPRKSYWKNVQYYQLNVVGR